MTVYKYVTVKRIDIFQNCSVRFTQAAALNDPFEAHPCFSVLRESFQDRSRALLTSLGKRLDEAAIVTAEILIPMKVRDGIVNLQQDLATNWPMLSLTKKRNNLLMWSHYADSHRGFVVGFDDNNAFFHREQPRTMSPLFPVVFSSKRPVVPRFEEAPNDLHKIVFLTKSEHWAYEEELRMFAQPKAASSTTKDDRGFALYLFALPPDIFSEIIFGMSMAKEDKRHIAAIVKDRYANVAIYEAKLNELDFDLDLVEYRL